ncbi:glutamine synthetase family protein [Vulgatibacter sp.]|uniref:glutamine synthetase family protein n=1 Tax=Vulgatibacter sp. TaxID=1971226 RepID=UPI0035673231
MADKRVRASGRPSGRVARKSTGKVQTRASSSARSGRVRTQKTEPRVRQETRDLEALRREFAQRKITTVKLGGFDVDGIFRGKYVSLEKFFSAAKGGLGFCDVIFGWDSGDTLYDNARLTGWHTGYPDAKARIDLDSYRPIPWEPGTAAFLLDYLDAEGEQPHPASPRGLLQRVVAKANAMGFAPKYSAEFEFFLFRETPESVREKNYQGLKPLSPGMFGYSWLRASENAELLHAIVDGCREFGIPIEGIHTETGPGVYEAAITYGEILEAADRAALFKTAVKEICARHGVMACFMAKWNADLPGCSGHVHQSLWNLDGTANCFADPKAERGMSKTMRHFLAGQLSLMPELTALVSPTINSYKRYVPGVWAPLNATWGLENRTCALRVIGAGDAKAVRIEHRQPAADMNPYTTMAAVLAAGLYGIERKLEPAQPIAADATGSGAPDLPRCLEEAVERLDKSRVAREILGDGFVDHYIRTRTWEVRQYQRAVTDWELDRYFEII